MVRTTGLGRSLCISTQVYKKSQFQVVKQSQPLQGVFERLAPQRRRACGGAVDDATGIDQTIEELATDVLAGRTGAPIVCNYRLLQVVRPFWPQRVVVFFRLVAEDLCANHSDAIDA